MANLTHLFKVGQKVRILQDDFDSTRHFNKGTVKATYEKPIYDKSGCDLIETRNSLKRRLDKYKIEKRVKEAAEIDYSQDITEISNSFDELKTEIITRLTKAKTSSDYNVINNVTDYKLTWLVRDIEKIKKHAEEKSFTSIDSAKYMIEKVKTEIKELKSKLA